MEQHVPMKYFRIRESDPWKPIHQYQHIFYLTTPITSFFVGALRLDCAPWIFVSPFLSVLRQNKSSPAPAPQFFASGSNIEESKLSNSEDGVGPDNFVVYDTLSDTISSLLLSNIIWLPLFVHTWRYHGFVHAVLLNSITFGIQASIVTKSLLTQHLCEDIKLDSLYSQGDAWYDKQVEASTTIKKNSFIMWLTFAISFQTEHHMFPCMNPKLLLEIQPIVQQTAKEFGLQYNFFPSDMAATASVYKQFLKLSTEPIIKNE
jgi:Fatty acid desaturase